MDAGRSYKKKGNTLMKILTWLRNKRLESDWGHYGLSAATINGYIRKNDKIELNVPLQIVRGLVDELTSEMVMTSESDALALAEKNGMMKGYYKVALKLRELEKTGRRLKAKGD